MPWSAEFGKASHTLWLAPSGSTNFRKEESVGEAFFIGRFDMSYGFIYFATNPSMPEVVKIGMTTKHPMLRLAELSRATACPEPFELLGFFDTPTPGEVERAIHDELAEYRINSMREFFSAPMPEIQAQAYKWSEGTCIVDLKKISKLVEQHDEAHTSPEEKASIRAWMESR